MIFEIELKTMVKKHEMDEPQSRPTFQAYFLVLLLRN